MIKIEFFTLDAGWIDGRISTEKESMYFSYSWISNFLNDLLRAVMCAGGYDDNLNYKKFTTYSEPTIDDWELSKNENDLTINICNYKDDTRKKLIAVTEFNCKYDEFIKALFDSLTKLLKKVGLYGYRFEWNEEFPLSLYLKLYDIIYQTEFLDLTLEETYGQSGQVSNVINELILINKILSSAEFIMTDC